MPNDPTLYPSIPSAQQQLVQRQGSLEARLAALESKRDLVITPINDLVGNGNAFGGTDGTMTFPWYGGRLWMTFGGRFYTNMTFVGYMFSPTVLVNGNGLAPAPVVGWTPASGQGGALAQVSYSSFAGLVRGLDTNTLTVQVPTTSKSSVDRVFLNGLIIEWPQA